MRLILRQVMLVLKVKLKFRSRNFFSVALTLDNITRGVSLMSTGNPQKTSFALQSNLITAGWKWTTKCFGELDLLSSAHHPVGCPSGTNHCVPPQVACFGEYCLTLGTRIVVRDFVEIRYQESVIFVDVDVHLGHPDFFEAQIFQRKGTFVVNVGPRIQQSPAGF